GSLEGIAASESSNNGTTGATLIPMMTLGIPGDVVTAVLLGGLMIQGLTPGPELFTTNKDLVYTIMIGFIIINIILFFMSRLAIPWFSKIIFIHLVILLTFIILICFLVSFA